MPNIPSARLKCQPYSVAICKDAVGGWHSKFADALQAKLVEDDSLSYEIINIDDHDWIEKICVHDAVIYKSSFMGVESASYFKEKIYFIERELKKIVLPNYASVWHFESKIAQSYLLKKHAIKTPKTFVSFDYHDALKAIPNDFMPMVFKGSHGAGSTNVVLIDRVKVVYSVIANTFCNQLWRERKGFSETCFTNSFIFKKWFWVKLLNNFRGRDRFNSIYWQEFIPNNVMDLRITVIGDRYAFGFWRRNRKDDFRASGSGNLDYETPVPEDALRYCIEISRRCGFDSMAYDLLCSRDDFVIVEMSYAYNDSAIYNSKGYFELIAGNLTWHGGNYWPQAIWIEWLMKRISRNSVPAV